ncbi:MAG: isoleucine--tRNA ligase [Thermoplasmatales archaeon]|nr:isoleucine--tRNA ligase [Thermoplasmatales archaeon]
MIKQVRPNYDAPIMEKEILEFWDSNGIYEKTVAHRENGEDFYFLDGPPYTTGSVHLGTALNKTIKDVLIRYWRMRGRNVRDQPGFDMHGLPIEVQVEKKIGVRSKQQIEEYGIGRFVETCSAFAKGLMNDMTLQFKRLGVWMDWNNPYRTLDPQFIEAAWWTLSEAYRNGLLVRDNRVLTWCHRCETALAEAEIEYWDEDDPSVMVEFPVVGGDRSLLIWTTTPWTLPSNMAVAAHPEFSYALAAMETSGGAKKVIVLESALAEVAKAGGCEKWEILDRMTGADLEGMEYEPPFAVPGLEKTQWLHKVVLADYVEEGNTGLVHTAPGFGPDDFETGKKYGLEPFCPVGEDGRFTDGFPMMEGKKVRGSNEALLEDLDSRGLLFSSARLRHRYGHCWRCKSPIIFRNTDQWFVKVTDIKGRMLDEIDRVKWVPDWAGSSRERNWVEGARDWCITRQRYWGIPLPVWECGCGETRVVGSFEELSNGDGYTEGMDPHRPWIDGVTFRCECGGTMIRVGDVLDVWFDSGVAGWAGLGWPSGKDGLERWWPARFIVEAHDQTRGWFYSQLAAGVISFDRAPYDEVMMHGWILDNKGQKMSKSRGNVVDPMDLAKDVGADSMRFCLLKANAPWEDTAFQKEMPRNARKVLNTYWNVVNFASTYMNIDGYDPSAHTMESMSVDFRDEDLWMVSRTEAMKRDVENALESRELHRACRSLENYILEDLSRWYVRLVRDRTWAEGGDVVADKNASYFTLHYAIMNAALALAPFCPFISEEVYGHMGGTLESIHMEDWPGHDPGLINVGLEESMAAVQEIVEIVAAERQKMGSKLRWPLKAIYVVGPEGGKVRTFDRVLAQQANVKSIEYVDAAPSPRKDLVGTNYASGAVFIDFEVTPDILAESYAREIIRRIQQMRKDMSLNVEDFINCEIDAEGEVVELCAQWVEHISGEVRALNLVFCDSPGGDEVRSWEIMDGEVVIGVSKAAM